MPGIQIYFVITMVYSGYSLVLSKNEAIVCVSYTSDKEQEPFSLIYEPHTSDLTCMGYKCSK